MADIDQMATSAVSVIVPFPVFINIIIEFSANQSNSRADGRFAQVEKKWYFCSLEGRKPHQVSKQIE